MVGASGGLAYGLSAAFLPPSLIAAIRGASNIHGESGWTLSSLEAVILIGIGWCILWAGLRRWVEDWRLRFFVLFSYGTSALPSIDKYLHYQALPQPSPYKLEMDFALSLLSVLRLRTLGYKVPDGVRDGIAL